MAETEKYPHVTYFFGGGEEAPEEGEQRELVPSPRDVPTYDHKPAMSAPEAAQAFCDAWRDGAYAFGIINFANADMVGHTGSIPAAVEAVETVDRCLGDVVEAVGATSARIPSPSSASAPAVTMSGTGFREWAVLTDPSSSSM